MTSNLLITVLICLLLLPAYAMATGNPPPSGEGLTTSPSAEPQHQHIELAYNATTKEELLLFWEEKDLYVSAATRTVKPLSQTAENMVVVTAADIERMNAHTVAEVLAQIPGVFVDPSDQDFGSNGISQIRIQGSEYRHVSAFLDGIPINSFAGNLTLNNIHPRIIDRIEVIKGPASSSWGSALGGIINIITKGTGYSAVPKGMFSASYGEGDAQDYSLELSGKAAKLEYYLFGGRQYSNGLMFKGFEMDAIFAKLRFTPSHDLDITLTAGYSDPIVNSGDIPALGRSNKYYMEGFGGNANIDYRISDRLNLKVQGYSYTSKYNNPAYRTATGALYRILENTNETIGGNISLQYNDSMNTAILGGEYIHGSLDDSSTMPGRNPLTVRVTPEIDKWALFANDTVVLGDFSVTPGVRLDHNNIGDYFVSPSLGATWEITERTVARASIARGFTTPSLAAISSGGRNLLPNPSLKPENVMSYQIGIESGVIDYLSLKATLFRHQMKNSLIMVPVPNTTSTIYVNNGDVVRQGYELSAESAPFWGLSLKGAFSYAHVKSDIQPSDRDSKGWDNYSYLLGFRYDDRQTFNAQLTGTYVFWNMGSVYKENTKNFIWDLNASKRIFNTENSSGNLFLTVHNLFNDQYYNIYVYPNPGRWVEGGIRFSF